MSGVWDREENYMCRGYNLFKCQISCKFGQYLLRERVINIPLSILTNFHSYDISKIIKEMVKKDLEVSDLTASQTEEPLSLGLFYNHPEKIRELNEVAEHRTQSHEGISEARRSVIH